MEKRIIDRLTQIRETETSHKRKQWSRSDHTGGGTLVSTWVTALVSHAHVGAWHGGYNGLRIQRIQGETG